MMAQRFRTLCRRVSLLRFGPASCSRSLHTPGIYIARGECDQIVEEISRLSLSRSVIDLTHPHGFAFSSRSFSTSDHDEPKRGTGEEAAEYDDGDDISESGDEEVDNGASEDDLETQSALPSFKDPVEEAAYIGYKVIGNVKPGDIGHFKPPKAFAVVQVGSHQFKISPGDCIYTEKLKFADVNDKLSLEKVLLLGSKSQTVIGRPFVPKAYVHAAVEEQCLDAKVIVFKKKRRKNYRRTRGHRQELTRLRILDIRGLGEARSALA